MEVAMSTAVADHTVQHWLSKLNVLTEIRDPEGRVLGYYTPVSQPETDDEVEKRFLALALLWKHGQGPSSSLPQMIAHPAYLQIISLGKAVLPLLLRELAREPDHWFSALSAITGEDPVPPESRGHLRKMTAAWLQWGRQHGLVS